MEEIKLTQEQKAVINAPESFVIVSAVAGSGKTQTLINRTRTLSPMTSKLILAFNKNAATEFENRLIKYGAVHGAKASTFHSFCLKQILQNYELYGFTEKPRVETDTSLFRLLCFAAGSNAQSWEQSGWDADFIKQAEHSMYDHELWEYSEKVRPVLQDNEFEEMKEYCEKLKLGDIIIDEEEKALRLEEYEVEAAKRREYKSCHALFQFRDWIRLNNIVNFATMIRTVAENTANLADIKIADHVMVDEFQDVDRFQFDIIKAIGMNKNTQTMMCVGDYRQRIYEWRGALENAFSEFKACFDAKQYELTVNFRSHDEIISHCNGIFPGMKGVRGKGGKNTVIYANGKDPDLKHLLGDYKGKPEYELELQDYAVLCRLNRDCAKWQIRFAKEGVPVFLMGKGDFWNNPSVKIAEEARKKGFKAMVDVIAMKEWIKLMATKKYRDNEETRQEAEDDAKFVLELTRQDYSILKRSLQREDVGIRVSTVHKVKGMEFKRVLIHKVDDKLKKDKCVYYTACTRGRDRLILA